MRQSDKAAASTTIAAVLRAVGTMAYRSDSVDGIMRSALEMVCSVTSWPLGHLCLYDRQAGDLRSTHIWHVDDPARYASFITTSEEVSSSSDAWLPRRVLTTEAPVWMDDVRTEDGFLRRAAALECDLRAGMGLPVVSSRGVEGVLEFFTTAPLDEGADLAEMMSPLGFLIGSAIDRVQAQVEAQRVREARDASEANLASAQRIARMGSWNWTVGSDDVQWSDELHRLYGVARGAAPVRLSDYLDHVHDQDRPRVRAAVEGTLATGEPYEHEYRIVRPDGSVRWMHARGEVLEHDGGRPVRLGGYCQDITERREAEEEVAHAHMELFNQQRVMERIARGEPVTDILELLCRDVEVIYPGTRCTVLLVDSPHEHLLQMAGPSMRQSFNDAMHGLPIAEGSSACGTAAARNRTVVVEDIMSDPLTAAYTDLAREHGLRAVWSQPLSTPGGEVLGTFAVYRDHPHVPDRDERQTVGAAANLAGLAIERDRAEHALSDAAHVDSLTGLPNRARFLELLAIELRSAAADVAVLFLDVDRFKGINDSLGHSAGDRVLVELAARLRSAVSAGAILARFGGDEFTVLIPSGGGDPDHVAAALLAAFVEPFVLDGGEFFLGASVGIATGGSATSPTELVRDADTAMFAAKSRGRGRWAWFDAGLRSQTVERVRLDSELRRAIERDELVMHYQPILDLRRGAWVAAEALVRWQHPSRGLLAPDSFIPLAEDTGLIIPLGARVLELVTAQMARWMSAGAPTRTCVNVSVLQLTDPAFAQSIALTLAEQQLPGDLLVVEITESALMDHLDEAMSALAELSATGAKVSIDDFGTGHSSIARIRELPVAIVKIDRRFIAPLGTDPAAADVVAAMVGLAHALRLSIVAEGVETEEQLARLRQLGCDCAQGYLLSRPMPAADVERVLRAAPPAVAHTPTEG